jgi:serine/threonine protein kinase
MTALFTRIACSKRDGIQFPADYDKKAKGKESRDLVQKLMHPDPVKRLGNTAAGTDGIKKHSYFNSINWEALVNKEVPPPWQPSSELGPAAGVSPQYLVLIHANIPLLSSTLPYASFPTFNRMMETIKMSLLLQETNPFSQIGNFQQNIVYVIVAVLHDEQPTLGTLVPPSLYFC